MNIIYVLIPLSIVLLGIALWAFFWAVKNTQFDDLETHAYRILDDDDLQPPTRSEKPSDQDKVS